MLVLFCDVETSDFHTTETPAYPVQLAAVLSDEETNRTVQTVSCIINWDKPVAERVIRIHGITREIAKALGEPPQTTLDTFRRMVGRAGRVAAHNVAFDVGVMDYAYRQLELPALDWPEQFCTMVEAAPIMKMPSAGGYSIGGFKAPRLGEAFHYFADRDPPKAHDALIDCYSCRTIYRGIMKSKSKTSVVAE